MNAGALPVSEPVHVPRGPVHCLQGTGLFRFR